MKLFKNATSDASLEKLMTPVEVEEAVRRRAYEFYEQRGYVDGHDIEDWLLAEQEVAGRLRQKTAA
jgi:hypothetical protein